MIFISTPHRGNKFADILSAILQSSPFGHSPQQYVYDLGDHSRVLEEISDKFRNVAKNLEIVSFYETLETPVGPMNEVSE